MSPMDRLRDRYENDPKFHAMVDALGNFIENLEMTPSEVREAALYACIRIEERRVPLYIVDGSELRMPTGDEEKEFKKGGPYR